MANGVSRHHALVGAAAGIGLLLALAAGWPFDGGDAAQPGAGPARPRPGAAPSAVSLLPAATVAAARLVATPVAQQSRQAAGAAAPVAVTVAVPPALRVGETADLVVALGAGSAVAEIGFTVSVDPDVLQVRAGAEGDWAADAAGHTARFDADIAAAEDRVRIRSAAPGRRRPHAGGSVALVQLQAVAPGTTSVIVSDVTVMDRAGNALPFALSSSNLQVTAESPPPAPAAAPVSR